MDHHMSSKGTSDFLSTASAVKMHQVPCSVSTTNAEMGKSVKEDNIKKHKKKSRSKNRRARQFTSGESSKTEEKKADVIRRKEHAEDRESSTLEKQAMDEKQKEVSSLWFKFVPQENKKGPRLPPLDKPHIRLKDSRATVTLIQKYIAQKLDINDYTEVDVVCCGEKLNGDMTLKDIKLIWMSHLPNSGRQKAKCDLEEAVIQLEYNRSEKLETPQKKQ